MNRIFFVNEMINKFERAALLRINFQNLLLFRLGNAHHRHHITDNFLHAVQFVKQLEKIIGAAEIFSDLTQQMFDILCHFGIFIFG